jgi:arylsulfatase A-like enzyme
MTQKELQALKERFPQCDLHGALQIPAEHTLTAFQAKETIAALERLKDTTFSITCSFHFPHAPMLPPLPYYSMYPAREMVAPVSISDDMVNSPYRSVNGRLGLQEYSDPELIKYMISNYYGLVREIDDWVGKILEKLDELGLTENTLVIFTSDHGEMLGAHGMREKNVFYEESAHIPLMMRLPEEIKSHTRVDGYVSHVDLFATILDYLDVEEHPSDGRSLRGLIDGTDREYGEYVVSEWNYRGDIVPNYMIVKGGWKLMIPYSSTSSVLDALYDLTNDPHEMHNLLGNNPEKELYRDRAEELRESLLEWLEKNRSKHYKGVKERELI